MKRILFGLPAFALLGGCAGLDPGTLIGIATGPIGQFVERAVVSATRVIECNLASTSAAGSFRYTSSNAACAALGGTPIRRVVVPAGTPVVQ